MLATGGSKEDDGPVEEEDDAPVVDRNSSGRWPVDEEDDAPAVDERPTRRRKQKTKGTMRCAKPAPIPPPRIPLETSPKMLSLN